MVVQRKKKEMAEAEGIAIQICEGSASSWEAAFVFLLPLGLPGPRLMGLGESGTIGEGDLDNLDESESTGSSAFDLASLGTYLTMIGPAWDRLTHTEEGPGS